MDYQKTRNIRNHTTAWSSCIHSVRSRYKIYLKFLMEFIRGNRYKVNFQHIVSFSNRWANGTNDSNFGRHAAIMCFGF
jgi:hypothetical protein